MSESHALLLNTEKKGLNIRSELSNSFKFENVVHTDNF